MLPIVNSWGKIHLIYRMALIFPGSSLYSFSKKQRRLLAYSKTLKKGTHKRKKSLNSISQKRQKFSALWQCQQWIVKSTRIKMW